MTIFKTRYKVRQDADTWLFEVYERKWYSMFWEKYGVEGTNLKHVLSFVPKDGVIV